MERDAAAETFVAIQQLLHLVGVASQDDNDAFALVFHFLHDCIDGLVAVAVMVFDQRVRFVDEEHAALCFAEKLFYDVCGPADIFANEICAATLDEKRLWDDVFFSQDFRCQPGDRRFRRTGIPRENHVPRDGLFFDAPAFSQVLELGSGYHVLDDGFRLREPHHVQELLPCRFRLVLLDLRRGELFLVGRIDALPQHHGAPVRVCFFHVGRRVRFLFGQRAISCLEIRREVGSVDELLETCFCLRKRTHPFAEFHNAEFLFDIADDSLAGRFLWLALDEYEQRFFAVELDLFRQMVERFASGCRKITFFILVGDL